MEDLVRSGLKPYVNRPLLTAPPIHPFFDLSFFGIFGILILLRRRPTIYFPSSPTQYLRRSSKLKQNGEFASLPACLHPGK